jgi:hypothetical protein
MKHADLIKRLIREVLSTPPKKDKCNCGCNTCKNVGNPGPVLNENLTAKIIMSENMKYHVDNKVALTENTFRYGSDAFLDLWAEARYLFSRNAIHVNDLDKEILLETNLGEYGMYNGIKVALDLPMLEEAQMLDSYEVDFFKTKANVYANIEIPSENPTFEDDIQIKGIGQTEEEAFEDLKQNYEKYKKGLYENENENELGGPEDIESVDDVNRYLDGRPSFLIYRDLYNKISNDIKNANARAEIRQDLYNDLEGAKKLKSFASQLTALNQGIRNAIDDKDLNSIPELIRIYDQEIKKSYPEIKKLYPDIDIYQRYSPYLSLNEAEKKKNPSLGKPKRGGSKKFYVYVRNPKTKKIKKVSFGQGGMSAKINNPKARKAFAARHKCAQKTDKTKASYWSCRLPRYAKLLGLKSSFSGFW